MILKEYPQLDERCWEEQLPNGLRIQVICRPGFARQYAFFAVDYGAIDTRFSFGGVSSVTPDGVAHYLEHKMFDMPEGDAMRAFSKLGGNPNAFTSYDMTAYYVQCTQNFEENLKLLTRMVFTPYFTPESVAKEQGIIAQEIRMYDDSADSSGAEQLFSILFDHHPIRVPIAGSVESIRAITPQILYDCHRAFYDPSNARLCVVGDVNPRQIVDLVAPLVPQTSNQPPLRDYGPPEVLDRELAKAQKHMDISMPKFDLGFRCPAPSKGEDFLRMEIVGDLAAEILMGEASPLYKRLYEGGQIDSSFGAGFECTKGVSMLTADGDSDVPEQVAEEILLEAERIGREGFDLARFERLKRSAVGRRMRDLDSFESICYRMCAYGFQGLDYFQFPQIYDRVTPEQVQTFLRESVRRERMALSTIYPNEGGSPC